MNNYQKHIEQINNLKNKPTLLLHVCCGVCSVYPLVYLKQFFNITIYFSNSNIYPYEEFAKRLAALETYLKTLQDNKIKLIVAQYDNETYTKKLEKYRDEPEGKNRCKLCYKLRMEDAYKYAQKEKYNYIKLIQMNEL